MSRLTVEQIYDGDWYDAGEFDYEICCDCLLVHRVRHRLYKGKLQLQVIRDGKETAKLRRQPRQPRRPRKAKSARQD